MCEEKARQNTIDEAIEILKARKEGKELECRAFPDGYKWGLGLSAFPVFDKYQYRVKPEEKFTFVLWYRFNDNPPSQWKTWVDITEREAKSNLEEAVACNSNNYFFTMTKYKEVL